MKLSKIVLPSRTILLLYAVLSINAKTITVGNYTELLSGINAAVSSDTILMRDGTYTVNDGYGAVVRKNNIVIKSLSNDREKVIVTGGGMRGGAQYGFWIAGSNVTIQGMTIQDVIYHCIQTDVNNHKLQVIDCILRDAYQQLLKIPAGATKSDSGLVEGCLFEFTKGVAENYYTGGVDCHMGKDWVIRNNTFKNIRSPGGSLAEHAIHFWNNSENILIEKNLIINCDRGIGLGMGTQTVHQGGIIRNNMIFHREYPESITDFGDVGIILENCANGQVYNNTIFFENSYSNAIEYRFSGTTGAYIANNLSNKTIRQRDGATGTVANNITNAQSFWFRSSVNGDLHLVSSTISEAIDKGISITGLTDDFDGNSRPQGSGIDIGADEYMSTGVNQSIPIKSNQNKPINKKILFFRDSKSNQRSNLQATTGAHRWFDLTGRQPTNKHRAKNQYIHSFE